MRATRRAVLAALAPACLLPDIIPLRIIDGFPIIAGTVHGTPVSFLLDTGAEAHLILPEAAASLHLAVLPGTVPLVGTGGTTTAPIVLLDNVEFGPIRLDPAPTPVAPLAALPRIVPPIAGLIGAKLLDQFDLEIDAEAGKLGLFPAGICAGPPDMGRGTTAIALAIGPGRQALLPVRVNGVGLVALLDTGSRATLLSAEAASRLGLHAPTSANTSRGVDGTMLPVGHLRVRELAVGDDVRRNVPISIAPLQLDRAELLLGLDFLRQRRFWISYVTSRLVIALPSPAPSAR